MDQLPCGRLLETRPTFSPTPDTPTDAPVQPQAWFRQQSSTIIPPVHPLPHRSPWPPQRHQKHPRDPFTDKPHSTAPETRPSINTIGVVPEVSSNPDQQANIQGFLAHMEQLGPTQTTDYHTNPDLKYSDNPPPMVTTTHEGIKTTTPLPLHRTYNLLWMHWPPLKIYTQLLLPI